MEAYLKFSDSFFISTNFQQTNITGSVNDIHNVEVKNDFSLVHLVRVNPHSSDPRRLEEKTVISSTNTNSEFYDKRSCGVMDNDKGYYSVTSFKCFVQIAETMDNAKPYMTCFSVYLCL